jgi:methylthioxylose transferase
MSRRYVAFVAVSIGTRTPRGEARKSGSGGPRVERATTWPLVVWAATVGLGAVLVYVVLVVPGTKRLNGVPLHATFDPYVAWRTLLPITVLAAAVRVTPRLRTLSWHRLLGVWWVLGVCWSVALAVARNPHRFIAPLEHRGEYLAVLPEIGSVGTFLDTFVERIATYPVHVQGHPPGFVLVAWVLRAVGLGGPLPVAVLVVVVGTAAIPLVLVCVRDVVGEEWARAAAPFLALGPAAIWVATTADAFYTGVGAAAVTLVVLATSRRGTRRGGFALAGGIVFGACAMLSYGLVLLAAIPLVVAFARRAWDAVVIAFAAAAAVIAAAALAGFWWVDGLYATRDRYIAGIASSRPYALFLVADVSILLLALGPAIAVAVWRLRDRSCWLLVGGALVALAIADLSGMSKSEVERIWLPFMSFVVLSAGALARDRTPESVRTLDSGSGWLVLQGGAAIVLESLVRTAW